MVVMGDWNGKVGEKERNGDVQGQYGIGERNDTGERIVELARAKGCKIVESSTK